MADLSKVSIFFKFPAWCEYSYSIRLSSEVLTYPVFLSNIQIYDYFWNMLLDYCILGLNFVHQVADICNNFYHDGESFDFFDDSFSFLLIRWFMVRLPASFSFYASSYCCCCCFSEIILTAVAEL